MSLEASFNAVAGIQNDPLGVTPSKTPSKGKDTDFNISTVPSTSKKLNYLNSSFHESSSMNGRSSSITTTTSQLNRNGAAANAQNPSANSAASSLLNLGNCTSLELLQAKIDHLEKERLELSLQLHNRSERERTNKIKLEQLDNAMKSYEENKKKLVIEITKLTSENHLLRSEKADLQNEITKLVKEIQSINHFETKDLWQKMTNLSAELKRIEKELINNNQEKNNLQKENSKLLLENQLTQEQSHLLTMEISELKQQYESLQRNHQQILDLSVEQEQRCKHYESQMSSLSSENKELLDRMADLTNKNIQLSDANLQLSSEIMEKEQQILLQAPSPIRPTPLSEEVVLQMQNQQNEISSLQKQIMELKDKLFENEKKRKQLHNKLQEYKGNIRVLIRCRPFLPCDDEEEQQQSLIIFHEDKSGLTILNTGGSNSRTPNYQYNFDHVFRGTSTQEDVYKEVTDLVQSVLDGYRVCIFSYGQTGSGKTHTMTGERRGPNRGIIPRAFEELLEQSTQLKSMGWEITIQMSVVELYNEEFRDLLLPTTNGKGKQDNKEKIKISYQNNRTMISGLTNHSIDMEDSSSALKQFHQLLDISNQTRTTASTNMNEFSSRSHLIVLIDFIGKHTVTQNEGSSSGGNRRSSSIPQTQQQSVILGGLKLCDLAGSERLDRTNTLHDNTRLRETVNINKSLSCLADVFNAVNNKQSHIPFRNSKLTMLLQDCLSGDGKSLMFVNISPTLASMNETICSLRFANQVSQVELGKAQKNIFTTAAIIPQIGSGTIINSIDTNAPYQANIPNASDKDRVSTEKTNSSANLTMTSSSTHSSNSAKIATNKPFSRNAATIITVPETNDIRESINGASSRNYNNSHRTVRFEPSESENFPQNVIIPLDAKHLVGNDLTAREPQKISNIVTTSHSFVPGSSESPLKATNNIPYSFVSSKTGSQVPTPLVSMNEKLQTYLQMKQQRNLGTCQRRSSVLPANGNLSNPARNSLLPSNSSVLETSVSLIGKRELAQIAQQERSFVVEANPLVKKTRTDNYMVNVTNMVNNPNSRRYNWR